MTVTTGDANRSLRISGERQELPKDGRLVGKWPAVAGLESGSFTAERSRS